MTEAGDGNDAPDQDDKGDDQNDDHEDQRCEEIGHHENGKEIQRSGQEGSRHVEAGDELHRLRRTWSLERRSRVSGLRQGFQDGNGKGPGKKAAHQTYVVRHSEHGALEITDDQTYGTMFSV